MPVGGRAVDVQGLKEFSRDLKRINAELPKQLRKAGLGVAKLVAAEARTRARSGTRIQRKAATAIKAQAGAARASVAVKPTAKVPFALGAFFGAKRYPQFEPWVGSTWKAGVAGEGPYAINPAIVALEDQIVAVYAEAVDEITKQAFPD